MAPAEKTTHAIDSHGSDRASSHHEGHQSSTSHGFSSPVLGEDRDRAVGRAAVGRASFAGAGGWVVSV